MHSLTQRCMFFFKYDPINLCLIEKLLQHVIQKTFLLLDNIMVTSKQTALLKYKALNARKLH